MLNENELKRYDRQMRMDGWGTEIQEKLKRSTVFVAGVGGLGSPVCFYLAAAGVGTLRLCDFDVPDWSNLNRQILHNPARFSLNKAASGKKTLSELNADVTIVALEEKIDENSVDRLVGEADIIVDCMDNFPTRYVLNDVAIRKKIPMVHGAIWGMEGRFTFLSPPKTPCLRCLVPEAPPKEIFPVVGATPGVIGSLQALECIKYLTGVAPNLMNRMFLWEGMAQEVQYLHLEKDPRCPACAG